MTQKGLSLGSTLHWCDLINIRKEKSFLQIGRGVRISTHVWGEAIQPTVESGGKAAETGTERLIVDQYLGISNFVFLTKRAP